MFHNFFWNGFGMNGIFWIIIIVLIIWVVLNNSKRHDHLRQDNPSQETALDILKKRYARGEISAEEFERMKRDIQ